MLRPRLFRSACIAILAPVAFLMTASGQAQSRHGQAQQAGALGSAILADHVAEAAQHFGIPEAWIWAVMHVESRGDPQAISPAGAMGLMQIMPATWAELRGRYGLGADPFDPRDNVFAGAAYLREMFDRYGDTASMLAAYNAGPGRYDRHLANGTSLPRETRTYLARLAPVVAGAASDPSISVPPDSHDWTRAPLFIQLNTGAASSDRPIETMRTDSTANDGKLTPGEATARPRDTIFALPSALESD